MKRKGCLWDQITSLDNIKLAHKQARRGKAFYSEVKMVDADIETYCVLIQMSLINKTFDTSPYEVEDRFDGRKMRTIYKLPYFPDRIIQHALLNVVGDIFVKSFIRDTFQSIQGRGTSDAARRVKKLVRSEQCPRYALKIDIEKYYPSINNAVLKKKIRKKIKCQDTLWLLDNIIDSMDGLPIGNYTSQHLGNFYLNDFDWYMKQVIKPSGYFRYCDDIVIFGNDKKELLKTLGAIKLEMSKLSLKIKQSWSIVDVKKNGIDFVGFRFMPEQTRLRTTIAERFSRACKSVSSCGQATSINLSKIMAYKGWVKQASAKQLWRKHVSSKLVRMFPKQLKGKV